MTDEELLEREDEINFEEERTYWEVFTGAQDLGYPNDFSAFCIAFDCMIATAKLFNRLKELFHYDEETGIFTRIASTNPRIKIGTIAGSKRTAGYIGIQIDRKSFLAHRLAWLYMTGQFPIDEIDHINHHRDDNRWSNLREVTHAENQKNKAKGCTNISGFTGISWDTEKEKYVAQIMANGKVKHLGYFINKNEAIKARKAANIKYGYHENHGQEEIE